MVVKKEDGLIRAIFMPARIDQKIEQARERLGYSRSSFYRYALTHLLQELSLLSEAVHDSKGDGLQETMLAKENKKVRND